MLLQFDEIITPAFIYDEMAILQKLCDLQQIQQCNILYPLKPCEFADILRLMTPFTSGFSVSSLYEATLAKEMLKNDGVIHLTTPGLRPDEIGEISELCDFISFNSLSQWKMYQHKLSSPVKRGLRINPQLSFVEDDRYNPCRKHSKLGVPLRDLREELNNSTLLKNLSGLLLHTNCESSDFNDLLETVKLIDTCIPDVLKEINWLNLGGGYLFDASNNVEALIEAISLLKSKYELDVYFEPGKGIVGDAGYIVASVIDLFKSDNRTIAILDTTVNHMPEVFEYQYKPDVADESDNGKYKYILAGSSCLAGDLFGEYRFDQPLEIGAQITFLNMGAYTLVKANMFNGINLPSIYAYTLAGKFRLKKSFGYPDFKARYGVEHNACK